MLQPRQAFSLLPPAPKAFPLDGSAVLNDTPVACQTRGPTRRETGAPISRRRQPPPTHCGAKHRNGRDLIIAIRSAHQPLSSHCCQRQRRRDSFAPRRELLLSAVTKVAKSTGRNCVSALPQRATPVRRRPRFPSRNRRFPDRCRSPDCASTAFRCRCLLLWQKLFVLPCRRLRNNYILCPTGTPTFAATRRQRRDLIIAIRSAHQPLPSLLSAAAAQAVQAIPEPTMLHPPHFMRECIPPILHNP